MSPSSPFALLPDGTHIVSGHISHLMVDLLVESYLRKPQGKREPN